MEGRLVGLSDGRLYLGVRRHDAAFLSRDLSRRLFLGDAAVRHAVRVPPCGTVTRCPHLNYLDPHFEGLAGAFKMHFPPSSVNASICSWVR